MRLLLLMLLAATPTNEFPFAKGIAVDAIQWDGGDYQAYGIKCGGNMNCARQNGNFGWVLISASSDGGAAASASPGLPPFSVQYNCPDGGGFCGASGAIIDGGMFGEIARSTHPAAPPAESSMRYTFQPTTGLPPIPYEISSSLQLGMPLGTMAGFGLQGNGPNWRTQCCFPVAGLTTSAVTCTDGMTAAVIGGSAGVAWDAGTFLGRNHKFLYQVVGVANTNAGIRSNGAFFWGGNGGGSGGWLLWLRFAPSLFPTARVFQGAQFGAAATIVANNNPSTELNTVYFGRDADAGHENCGIWSNDQTGTATTIVLDGGFPCGAGVTGFYDVWFWQAPGDGGINPIDYFVQRLNANFTARGTITTDLPQSGAVLGSWHQVIGSGYVASSGNQHVMGNCTVYQY